MRQQAGSVSGSGGAAVEVCLCAGVSAGQVGQVERLTGNSWEGLSGAFCWKNANTANSKEQEVRVSASSLQQKSCSSKSVTQSVVCLTTDP